MTDAILRECFELWPAWTEIVERVSSADARTADPCSIYGAACGADCDRLAALLYAHHHGDTMDEAHDLLDELLRMARDGKRPRYGRELGFTRAMFEGPS